MPRSLLPLPLLLLAACSYSVEPERVETFVPEGAVELIVIEEDSGFVDAVGGDVEVPQIDAAIYGSRTELSAVEADGVLTLTAVCAGPACAIDYRVLVPPGVALAVRTDSGAIRLTELTGDLALVSDSGSVRIDDSGGPGLDLRVQTDSGSVELDAVAGDRVRIETDSGSVDAEDLACTDADVETESGPIELQWDARPTAVEVESESGSVVVEVPAGAYAVTVSTESGTVDLRGLTEDPTADRTIDVRTESGSVSVEGR